MSYRALKRLLGETSLERKCRFLFGGFILLLISGSFYLYARQTEHLAYDQITTTCRLLLMQIVDRDLATVCRPAGTPSKVSDEDPKRIVQALDEFRIQWEQHWPDALRQYQYRSLRPDSTRPENKPDDPFSAERLKAFQADPKLREDSRSLLPQRVHQYYGAIRATKTCLACHKQFTPDLTEDGLIALIKIEVPTSSIESGVDLNRAILISTAIGTALLIMGGSFILVRYVIVKPVKHLKEVSDAISAGELNVRSEIQTGDEFEDLSHAFNRMLRTLVSMQDRLRKVNQDLDHKVDELAQANLALYESNRLKSDFLATMTHELRTPLNSILGFSEVLQAGLTLTEKQARWLGNIRTSGEQLLNMINDILDLAKIEAGKMEIHPVEFSTYDVCEGLLTMFRPQAEKKNIDLAVALAPDIPLIHQDVNKFRQILSNLLSNAIKFTPEGGRVAVRGKIDGDMLEMTVTDTGVGIAAEDQELIFEKFRQSGNPMTREQGGTGLGLSIVRELTQILGGTVSLQSELGRGSTFTILLPLQLSDEGRLEYDLAHEGVDLSKAQRVDARLYGSPVSE
jgi:signal transduction histidine kinase